MKNRTQLLSFCISSAFIFISTGWSQASIGTNLLVDHSFEGPAGEWKTGIGLNPIFITEEFVGRWTTYSGIGTRMALQDTGHPGQDGGMALAIKSVFPISVVQVIDVSSLGDIAGMDYRMSVSFAEFGTVFDARFSLYGFDDFTSGVTVDLGGVSANAAITNATRLFQSPNVATWDSSANFRTEFKGQTDGVLSSNTIALSDFNYLAVVLSADADLDNDDSQYFAYDNIRMIIGEPKPTTWAGFSINSDGWVDTGHLMGWVNISHGDWVWLQDISAYIYLPESNVSESGAWVYAPKY